MLRRLSSRLQSCFFQQIFVLFSAPSAISFAFGSLRVLVRQLLNSRLFVCIGGQMVLGFLMPDSDQRLSAKISGEKGFDFSPCLRVSVVGFGFDCGSSTLCSPLGRPRSWAAVDAAQATTGLGRRSVSCFPPFS